MQSNDQPSNISYVEEMLVQLRHSFVQELPERCNTIENLLLTLHQAHDFKESFYELYRQVHNLKGTAGTHDIHIISTICHHLEEKLNTVNAHSEQINKPLIDTCLGYIDLIHQAKDQAHSPHPDYSQIEWQLHNTRQSHLETKHSGLIVMTSNLMALICKDSLASLPIDIKVITGGLTALTHLIHIAYDFVVLSKELDELNGLALTYAIRTSDSINQKTKILMITSRTQAKYSAEFGPDKIILKDTHIASNLQSAIKELVLVN